MNFTFKRPLWAKQLEAFNRAAPLTTRCFGLLFGPGAGKTGTAINILRFKYAIEGRVLKTLIFTLPTVIDGWEEEWQINSNIKSDQVVKLKGSGKERLKLFLAKKDTSKVFITNYESLLMEDLYEAFLEWVPEAVIGDESHTFKSVSAKRSKALDKLTNPYQGKIPLPRPLVYILTGSPIDNSPMDIFMQFLVLDGGETFGKNFWMFRARFFRDRNASMPKHMYFPKWELMTEAKDGIDGKGELNRLINKKAMIVDTEDVVELPEENIISVKVGMTKEQERLYKEMKDDLVTYYKSQACVGSLAITKGLRLMQITSGYVSTTHEDIDGPVEHALPNTPKMQALKDLLVTLTENDKVLVWAVWKHNYKEIRELCESLKLKYVEVHGMIPEKQKALNLENFAKDPSIKVFIGHPKSGGVGTDKLKGARYAIRFSRNFSYMEYKQSMARNRRGGSIELFKKITYYDLVVQGTVDEQAVEKLQLKQDVSADILKQIISN